MTYTDPLAHKARAARERERRQSRELVCDGCVRPLDFVFGRVHSAANCHRCGKQCGYGAVVGSGPLAEATR